ncbi:hypothetical protein V6N11_059325 [Hibiscus sabdariffa]|uniref:Uncharacterized protein n=1 Tax=Hibiscus sabdariffa TaxID=183260 RepID=A0ABR2U6Y0_9ROSI
MVSSSSRHSLFRNSIETTGQPICITQFYVSFSSAFDGYSKSRIIFGQDSQSTAIGIPVGGYEKLRVMDNIADSLNNAYQEFVAVQKNGDPI